MQPFHSNETTIRTAACPVCCAYRGEPCSFARCEDKTGERAGARKSHDQRTANAKASNAEYFDWPGGRLTLTL